MSSIFALINDIEAGDVVLPAIQRDFVWDTGRIEKLFDSLMRGYPVGIVLLWETYESIQYRRFVKDYRSEDLPIYKENTDKKRIRYVLDGQQRLTSINIALNGTHEGKEFYINLLSGLETDDTSEEKYHFKFSSLKEIQDENALYLDVDSQGDSEDKPEYWFSLPKLLKMPPIDALKMKSDISASLGLTDSAKLKLDENISQVRFVFNESSECLKTQTIDASLPADYKSRKTVFDILEIFVRINSQGVRLSRSDLIVSMLRLYWPDVSSLLPKFIEEINKGSDLKIDTDFVIRCLFSTSGLGTRLDFDLLRKKANVDLIRQAYDQCLDAIRSTVDFVRIDCKIDSGRMIGGLNTLIPFVHFLYFKKTKAFKAGDSNARKALYLFAFSKIFTQHSDSRTGAFIRDFMSEPATDFPMAGAAAFITWKTGFDCVDDNLIGNNSELALSLLQGRNGGKVFYSKNLPEIDHIFPRSTMEEKYDSILVNNIGNLWILQQLANRNKSAKDPKIFLAAVDKGLLLNALIDIDTLDKRKFRSFVDTRRTKIVDLVCKMTGLADADVKSAFSNEEGEDEDED